jgi:hypothetical protein
MALHVNALAFALVLQLTNLLWCQSHPVAAIGALLLAFGLVVGFFALAKQKVE